MKTYSVYHSGVLGMKWGKRKTRTPSSDHAQYSKIRKKKIEELSNDELRAAATRKQLEKNYKDLHPSKLSSGKKIVTGILVTSATSVASVYTARAMTRVAEKLVSLLKKG